MKKWNVLGGVTAAAIAGVLMAMPVYAGETAIPEGIYVGDFSLGGMTEAEAAKTIQDFVDSQEDRKVTLKVEDQTADTTAGELGYAWMNPDAVKEAAEYQVTGNLIQRYMGLKDLEKNPVQLPLETEVDETKVDAFVKEHCEGLTGGPQNAVITRENDTFVITPGASGKAVDAAATKEAVDQALAEPGEGAVTVTAAVTVEEPEITEEDLSSIQDVLGTFSTDFSSSGAARSKNLTHGASKINGQVLMPGDTLSGYELMHPFTTENGYHTAAAYENGQVVDSVGGGVCQIATTLYNAALRSELEITQRQNHSMIVGYVKPSMDAAIAGTYKDIKITNNYSTPIYVEGGTHGRTLTFTIYGKETRPENRTIEFVSETLSVTDPGAPIERPDASIAPGGRKQVQSAHRGLKSQLWKVVKVDGVETERTLLHKDTYNASKAIVLVGPAAPAQPTDPAVTDPNGSGTDPMQPSGSQPSEPGQSGVVEGLNGGPGVTTQPTPGPSESTGTPGPSGSAGTQESSGSAGTPESSGTSGQTPAPGQASTPAPMPGQTSTPEPAPTPGQTSTQEPAPAPAPTPGPTDIPAPAPAA